MDGPCRHTETAEAARASERISSGDADVLLLPLDRSPWRPSIGPISPIDAKSHRSDIQPPARGEIDRHTYPLSPCSLARTNGSINPIRKHASTQASHASRPQPDCKNNHGLARTPDYDAVQVACEMQRKCLPPEPHSIQHVACNARRSQNDDGQSRMEKGYRTQHSQVRCGSHRSRWGP